MKPKDLRKTKETTSARIVLIHSDVASSRARARVTSRGQRDVATTVRSHSADSCRGASDVSRAARHAQLTAWMLCFSCITLFLNESGRVLFKMPSSCIVPNCNARSINNDRKRIFHVLPHDLDIHVIRRGQEDIMSATTNVNAY
ncbi:hypothetical protein MSG28_012929 [Choristoneura fumiferana]|uniref:Uncharacterized protein n=1 Tax=Choristoneura fumiferana TaxID=7141 RepID=A0ACC0KRQ1_CHOFU|nr:hypothetical protein MSG28_012929 [Choristoneura fumiferana]